MISFLANPLRFQRFAKFAIPVFGVIALICIIAGVGYGLWNSPPDALQGESVRVMYVHVPAAWTSMMAYALMGLASMIYFIWRHPLADNLAYACALPGLSFTALTLLTGSLWGKSSWGTYWQWDGRMTSYLLLLFLYIGYLCIRAVIENKHQASRIAAIVAIVGLINLPIIKYSVEWWRSLHQAPSISAMDAPGLPWEMARPALLMAAGYTCLFAWLVLSRVQISIEQARLARTHREQKFRPAKIDVESL